MFYSKVEKENSPCSNISKRVKNTQTLLRKILQILHNKGILKASRGYGGGFSLALPANKIFLQDLIGIFQGQLKLNECIFKKKICPDRSICPLKKKIDGIEKYVISKLESVSIVPCQLNRGMIPKIF